MAALRTQQGEAGERAEAFVAARLAAAGWRILARNVHAGRSELDVVAVDPGPPARLVVVEVRWRRSRSFGLPEETFDARKRAHLRRGLARLLEDGLPPPAGPLPHLPVAVDLVVAEPDGAGGIRVRHYRDALIG